MTFQKLSFGLTGLFIARAAPALAVESCDMNLAVTMDTGVEAVIIGGPVAEMCIIKTIDGNMFPHRMDALSVSTAEPLPTDVRSITPGPYNCMVYGDTAGAIKLVIEMTADNTYSLTDQGVGLSGEGTWKAYDNLSIQFLDGPFKNSFVTAQNSSLDFGEWQGRPAMYCKKVF
jgi:hypothetical protein